MEKKDEKQEVKHLLWILRIIIFLRLVRKQFPNVGDSVRYVVRRRKMMRKHKRA